MKVSVIIPTYNRRDMVQRAVRSVLKQTRPADEVIVIDDGSTDDTASSFLGSVAPVKYVFQRNGGVSRARNRGLEESTGEVVAFLDSDDEWLPPMLQVMCEGMEGDPDVVAAAANGEIRAPGGTSDIFSSRPRVISRTPERVPAVSGALLQPVTSGILIRRSALTAVGAFNPDVLEFEDFDLWSRLSTRGPWLFCSEPLWIHYREVLDDANVSQQYWRRPVEAYLSLLRSHERLLGVSGRSRGETTELRRAIGHFRCLAGALSIDRGDGTAGRSMVARSAFDWPSPRRVLRALAVLGGWRPVDIRGFSTRLRGARGVSSSSPKAGAA